MLKFGSILSLLAKKSLVPVLLVSGVFAVASMGGGGSKSTTKTIRPAFVPIRTTNGFTMKAGPVYHGSMAFGQERTKNSVAVNSLVTYQKGNTTYILPYRYKMPAQSSSLQLLNVKIPFHH